MTKMTKAQLAETIEALRAELNTLHMLRRQDAETIERLTNNLNDAQTLATEHAEELAQLKGKPSVFAEVEAALTPAAPQPKPAAQPAKRSYTPDAAWQADVERKKAIMAAAREQAMRSGRTVRVEV